MFPSGKAAPAARSPKFPELKTDPQAPDFAPQAPAVRWTPARRKKGDEMYKKLEGLVLETPGNPRAKNARPETGKADWLPEKKVETHLADGMVGSFHLQKPRTFVDFLVSVLGHSVVVAVLILLPLYYTQAINMPQFEKTLLVAPPPPPPSPPPAPVHVIQRVPKSFFTHGKLYAPKFIPKKVEQVKEEQPPTPATSGVTGGVVGGVPGGQLGGVLGGILGGNGQVPTPPPPKPVAHKGPYRVGGKVQAPKLIRQVQPIYPPLAKQARIQGDVVIESVIDQQGKVTQMKVVSGSPLLVQSAIQALEQWRYQPTLLNGQPVAVDMLVTLHFQLGGSGEPS
jgi:protein TonB